MKSPVALISILAYVALVSAHGFVTSVTIAGKVWHGWDPFTDPYLEPLPQGIVRKPGSDGPVTDIHNASLACNTFGTQPAALMADANAGDSVTFQMNTWLEDHLGPLTGWMANCNGNCMSFNPTQGNVWFKISQDGLDNGTWASQKLIAHGDQWTLTMPPTIKAGQYLARFELLALHSTGAPQFYPFCAQLNIHGTGSSVPTSSELVSIPGVYDNAGDAIYGDIWQNPTTWTIADPSPVPFAVGSSNNGGTVTQTGTAQPTNTGTPMQSPNPVTKSGKCKAKKRNTSLVKRAVFDQVKGSHVKLRRSRGMFWLW